MKKTNKDIEIRKAAIGDFDQLFKLKLESKKDEKRYNKQLEPIEKVKNKYKEYLIKDLESKHRAVFIALDDGKIIGMIIGRIYRSLHVTGYEKRGSMGNLYVKKSCRKKGLGVKLMEVLIDWFKSRKVTGLTLAIYQENNISKHLYKGIGFEVYCEMMYKKI